MNKNWIKNSPWESIEEFEKELEDSWEEMKRIGLESGLLTKRKDGAIIGHGHPNKWFDIVEKELKNE
jgi:hypothetical protein